MKYRTLSLLATLLLAFASSAYADDVPLGLWSWSQDSITTASARAEMLEFCRNEGITHIDQHVSIRRSDEGMQIRNANKLSMLLDEAANAGVSVSALVGDKSMFFAKNHETNLAKLSALIEFNRSLPEGSSLVGIKYDVEPYLSDEWKAGGESRQRVMRDYLDGLSNIRQLLLDRESTLELRADVPFWWDKPELVMHYAETRQPFVHHIQAVVDSIGIMSYRRRASDVIRLSSNELAFARTQGRRVAVGLNFNDEVGDETVTTFAGHPPAVYRQALAELREKLRGDAAIERIMLHDYKHLKAYLSK